ncbi:MULTISPECIES: permease [Citrobacter]|uniref:permease n=1 Tax=Citrobacter TaxID=544 RepID=UPI0004565026|nr:MULTISPECIES: permease [Citrobacter]AHY13771.1 transporter [Citrobacter freundii CFNIH1]KAA0552283.1 permease [Citrobacter werkmanii]MBD0821839.1 permease [Citrobacter sp. C5_2]MBE0007275.1 permease [Citrobacter freundii]MBJ8367309.1 permease [Citrobacter cronae]
MNSWISMFTNAAEMFLFLAVELSALFFLISAGVSLIRQKIPDQKIQRMLGARKGRGYILASLLGAVTPFCSCSTIPMLRGLLSAKAGFGPTLTFLFVSPLLNPIIIGLMWVTFGWKVTLLYAVIAATVSVLASILLDVLGFDRHIVETSKPLASCCGVSSGKTPETKLQSVSACCSVSNQQDIGANSCSKPQETFKSFSAFRGTNCELSCETGQTNKQFFPKSVVREPGAIRLAFQDAWTQFKDVLPYMMLGIVIGSFIYGFIPAEWIAAHAGNDNPFAIPLSAIIGIPLYIRAEAVIPLASVLMDKGMGTGAVMALIIGSAGASLTEVILLKSMFKTPLIAAFLTVILGMAIIMGYLTQLLF